MKRGRSRERAQGRRSGALLAALVALACSPREPDRWRNEARRLVALGQPVEALAIYQRAAREGHRPDADLEAARLMLRHQKVGWALESLRTLAARFPTDARVQELGYEAALSNRLFDEALSRGRRLLDGRPGDARLLRHVGVLELKAGQAEAAVAALARSSAEDASAPSTWYALGRALEAAYRDEEAILAYRRRLDLEPEHGETRWRLARLLAQDDAALREAEVLIAELAAEPDPPSRLLHLLGSVRVRLGRVEEGRRLLAEHARRAAGEASREHDHLRYNVLLDRVVVQLGDGAMAEVDRLLAELARLPPSTQDERLAVLRSESLLSAGKRSAALEELSSAVTARPQMWRYRYLRAEVLAALGLRREALADLDAVDRLQPFALEARRLRLLLVPARSPAREQEASRLAVLEAFAGEEERQQVPAPPPLAGRARARLLLDAMQLHPLARLPEPHPIPMD
ncbi:MAG: hypothetical protein ACRD0X_04260 [Thermoanaerobaculia bacterium]